MANFSAANSLEFQAKQQIKPYQEEEFVLEFVGDETHRSRKRKFVLACSDFLSHLWICDLRFFYQGFLRMCDSFSELEIKDFFDLVIFLFT